MSVPDSRELKRAAVEIALDGAAPAASASSFNAHVAALSAFMYVLVMGMVGSYSAPATVDMQKPGSRFRGITQDEITWIGSLPMLSGMIGNGLSGYLAHTLGRKALLMYMSIAFVGGWLMIAYATSVAWIYAGRFITGICTGASVVACPAYVVEISTPEIRGRLSTGFQLCFALGVFITMSLSMVLRWSWLAISGAVIVTCGSSLMYFMPESPPWLVGSSKKAEALRALIFLRGKSANSKKEISTIEDSMALEPSGGITIREFLEPTLYKPLAISIALMFFQQFSGIAVLLSYSVEIFKSSGGSVDPEVASTIVAAIQVIAAFISSLLVDKAGRRILYMTSGSLMSISLVVLGLYSVLSKTYGLDIKVLGWIPLLSFMVYIAAFAFGFGPIPYIITPEMVPVRSRSTVLCIACVTGSFLGFVITKTFDVLRTVLHDYGLYWAYASFTLCGCIFSYFYLPETKGRSLEEINRSFAAPKQLSSVK